MGTGLSDSALGCHQPGQDSQGDPWEQRGEAGRRLWALKEPLLLGLRSGLFARKMTSGRPGKPEAQSGIQTG